jgi:ATP-dependent Clp protease ATP-binding subunit ClpA
MFHALSPEDLHNILLLQLKGEKKMAADRGLTLDFSDAAVAWMLAQNNEPEYGARPLKRIIRRSVREPLADFLLKVNPPPGTQVKVDADANALKFAALVDGKEMTVGN